MPADVGAIFSHYIARRYAATSPLRYDAMPLPRAATLLAMAARGGGALMLRAVAYMLIC